MAKKGSKSLTKRVDRYNRIFGHCSSCQAPVWFNRIIDNSGTPLLAYHCWNGHYHTLDAQILDLYRSGRGELSPIEIKRILPFVKFIRLVP